MQKYVSVIIGLTFIHNKLCLLILILSCLAKKIQAYQGLKTKKEGALSFETPSFTIIKIDYLTTIFLLTCFPCILMLRK